MPSKFLDRFKKQGSLSDAIDEVRQSYSAQTRAMAAPMMDSSPGGYVQDVYEDHVVACDESGDYWSIPYTREAGSDDVVFDFENATEVERTWTPVEKTVVFEKLDEDNQTAFGWAYVFEKDGTRVLDHSDEFVTGADLETAAYEFNLESREGDDWHTENVEAHLIESVVITDEKLEAMGIEKSAVKQRGWFTGWYFPDPEMFAKVKSGERPMLSIGGVARREHVDA